MLVVSQDVGDLDQGSVQLAGVGFQGVAGVVLHNTCTETEEKTDNKMIEIRSVI